MRKVCVITGGGSGMGLEAAKIIGRENYVIICGRNIEKLEAALTELNEAGIKAEAFTCDVSNRKSVHNLAIYAKSLGEISSVIHCAGMSPHMGNAKKIMEVNALGTIYMNEEFYIVMEEGSCIINVSSMAGHLIPKIIIPKMSYRMSRVNRKNFMNKMMARVKLLPQKYHSDVSYGISKNFVIWYSATEAMKFGQKGIRVLSVSPGNFETPMGKLEEEEASTYLKYCAIKKFGNPKEIAELMAFVASSKPGYLTGTDILMDGGCVSGKKLHS